MLAFLGASQPPKPLASACVWFLRFLLVRFLWLTKRLASACCWLPSSREEAKHGAQKKGSLRTNCHMSGLHWVSLPRPSPHPPNGLGIQYIDASVVAAIWSKHSMGSASEHIPRLRPDTPVVFYFFWAGTLPRDTKENHQSLLRGCCFLFVCFFGWGGAKQRHTSMGVSQAGVAPSTWVFVLLFSITVPCCWNPTNVCLYIYIYIHFI